jgi:HPt (histidine-containing phosphotransfer) domain-containing protein
MPILALTANALRGEAMRAQAAGMDEYLTKPLQLELLKAALKKWLPRVDSHAMRAGLQPPPNGLQGRQVVDVTVLRSIVGDNPRVVRQLLADYGVAAERFAQELRAAHVAEDIRRIGAIAHQLKASSRSIGALALGDSCAELENACRSGVDDDVSRGVVQFEAAMREVDAEIAVLLAGQDLVL